MIHNGKLKTIRDELGDCKRCHLSEGRTNIVFGIGDPNSSIVFIGEAPGRVEDKCGEPFTGPAGQVLNKLLAAVNLTRQQVYITNPIKCRPPDNRVPNKEELAACTPFLTKQLEAIKPKVIVALGKSAANFLLGKSSIPMQELRGKWYTYTDIPVMVTYHPSYIMRLEGTEYEEARKLETLSDIRKVLDKVKE